MKLLGNGQLGLVFRRWRVWLCAIAALLLIGLSPVQAQGEIAPSNQIDGYPIMLDGQELFRVKHGIPGAASAEERAKIIYGRLIKAANDPDIALDSIQVQPEADSSAIKVGKTTLLTIRQTDLEPGQTHQAIAEHVTILLKPAIAEYRQSRSAHQLIQGIILAVLSTIALVFFLALLQRLLSKLLIRIRKARREDALDLRIQNFQILGSQATSYLLTGFLQVARLVLVLGSLYVYIPFLLSQFPTTKEIGRSIFHKTGSQIEQLTNGLLQYLPNLAIIVIIGLLTYYVIQFAKLVITELGRDDAYPWFYPEWIEPTNRLATILIIAVACVIAGPYLPGFGSPAFQGISLFLGALLTLGSSSAIANTISGIILIYTRAFRIGDMIRIGDITGEVIEKSLFVTRLLTFKQEVITIPNSSVLNSNVVNFSAISREKKSHLVLHTTVTLGYDLPWRQVHEVLIQAAKATGHILSHPTPFVLQTSLNDFHVSYELNAFTAHPQFMPLIYSELHQNIQDYCNQAGIEILSPGFSALRDGNHSTIPADYLPENYISPMFQIHSSSPDGKKP